MSTPGAIGVDLGSQNVLIGCAQKGGIEIMTNEGSHRETPFVVGYGPNERFIGEHGAVQLKSNFKNTVIYPLRFLGMKGNSSHLDYESKFIYNKLATLPDNRVGFSVSYQGETVTLLPEQVVATMLQKLKEIVHKNDIGHSNFVLSVPSYFTEQERRALLDAAKLAGINVVRLINEHTAITLSYGIFRKAELDVNPRNVLFIDIGHSNTSVFLAGFTKDKVTILDQYHERSLGARDIDWILLEYYSNMFNQANGLNPMKSDKARLRLLDAIEKQRKILSANSEAVINLEYLMEDFDLNHTLTRVKYEQMISPIVARVKDTILKLNLSKYPIHSIEILGGATRIPIIQKAIQDVCGKLLSKTLHATECIAKGAALQAAILSPLFKVSDYIIDDASFYPIRCSWKFHETAQSAKDHASMELEDGRNNISKQTSVLFDAGSHLPSLKSINFHREEAVEFKLFYDPVPFGAEEHIATYLIENTQPQCPDFKVKLRVQLNRDGLVEFDSSQLIEEWDEGEKAGGSGDQAKKIKSKSTNIKTEIIFQHGLSLLQAHDLMEEEKRMASNDKLILDTYHQKNLLESYIYEARGKMNESYKNSAASAMVDDFLARLADNEQWLYGDGAKAKKEDYVQRLEDLKAIEAALQKKAAGADESVEMRSKDQKMDISSEGSEKEDIRTRRVSPKKVVDKIDIEE